MSDPSAFPGGASSQSIDERIAELLKQAGLPPIEPGASMDAFMAEMLKPEPHVANEVFERWYADLRTPTPVDPLSASWENMTDFFWGDSKETLVRQIEELANANDVAGMRRLHEATQLKEVLEDGAKGHSPATTYCVAHMLVDGSGNEGFAREWINSMGYEPRMAAAQFHHISLVSDRTKLQNQKLLGLSTLVDVFHRPERGMVPYSNFAGPIDTPSRVAENCRILAAILRLNHPDKPPRTDYRERAGLVYERPLTEVLWSGEPFHNLLPAIEQAYGRGNPQVEREMAHHLRGLIFNGKLQWKPTDAGTDALWDSMSTWRQPSMGSDILSAKGEDGELLQKTLMSLPDDLVIRRLEQLKSMGARLDDLVEEQTLVGKSACTLLHRAILREKVDTVAWLLMNDCDPRIQSISELSGDKAHDGLACAALVESSSEQGAKIASMVRAAAASKAAHEAFAEMGMHAPGGVRP